MFFNSAHEELLAVLNGQFKSIDDRVQAIGTFTGERIIPIFTGSIEPKLITGPASWYHAEVSSDPSFKLLDLNHGIDLFVSGTTTRPTATPDKVGFGLRVHCVPPGYQPHMEFMVRLTTNGGNQLNSEYEKRLKQINTSGVYNDFTFEFYLEDNDRLHWGLARTNELIPFVSSSLDNGLSSPQMSRHGFQYATVDWSKYKQAGNYLSTGSIILK
jgi:hypothetical protein